MDMLLLTIVLPVLAIQLSTILLIAAALCFLALFIGLLMKKRPSKSPDSSAEASGNADCAAVATGILAGAGGRDNISSADCCATSLRLGIRDYTAINEKAVKAAGAAGVTFPTKTTCQIAVGSQAQLVCDELKKLL